MSTNVAQKPETADRISELLTELSKGKINLPREDYANPFKDLGVDSVLLLTLIVGIEDTFGYEWDDETPETVFFTINSMAEFLESEGVTG